MKSDNLLRALRQAPLFHWLLLPVGMVLVYRYRWMMDDAYVYFRYADNLVLYGSGLVYNAGAYVEGYSSPGWMLLIAAARWVTGNYQAIILALGFASFALFWAGLIWLNFAVTPPDAPQHNLPLLYLVGNYAVLCYFTSGLETPLVQLAAIGFAWLAFSPRNRGLQIALAFTPLIRPELVVPLAIILLWVAWHDWRRGLLMALACFVVNAAWLAFRIYYYADLFPNTFHLKNETNWAQGLIYVRDTAEAYLLLPYLIAMAVMLAGFWQTRPDSEHAHLGARGVIVLCALSVTVYVMKIGGDPRHYRYLAFPFCLIVAGTCGITENVATCWREILSPQLQETLRKRQMALIFLGAAIVLLWTYFQSTVHAVSPFPPMAILLSVYVILVGLLHVVTPRRRILLPLFFLAVLSRYPFQLANNPILGRPSHLQIDLINDATTHRDHLRFAWDRRARINEARPKLRSFADYEGIVLSGICGELYMHADRWAMNFYGLTDPFLSHADAPSERPAHKAGLEPLAFDLHEIYLRIPPGPGTFRKAVETGIAPVWVAENLASLEAIERQVYNEHDMQTNLRLALTSPSRITPPQDYVRFSGAMEESL